MDALEIESREAAKRFQMGIPDRIAEAPYKGVDTENTIVRYK